MYFNIVNCEMCETAKKDYVTRFCFWLGSQLNIFDKEIKINKLERVFYYIGDICYEDNEIENILN